MHIACAADSKFLPHVATMLASLLSQHAADSVHIHFLCDEHIDKVGLQSLLDFVGGKGARIDVLRPTVDWVSQLPHNRRFGATAWFRVALPSLLPEQDRVLYLDADTLVLAPLQPLWDTPLKQPLGAVVNPLYPFMDTQFITTLGLDKPAQYFNSGVLLMDLAAWREQGLEQQVLAAATQIGQGQEWPDQNILNQVFANFWQPLPVRFNVQNTLFDLPLDQLPVVEDEYLAAREQPAVVHFIGPYKPWHRRCKHSLRDTYWAYRRTTPWPDAPLDGNTRWNRWLHLLPEMWSWKVDVWLKNLRTVRRSAQL